MCDLHCHKCFCVAAILSNVPTNGHQAKRQENMMLREVKQQSPET